MFSSGFRDDLFGDHFEQMENMMNSMFDDPFFTGGMRRPSRRQEQQIDPPRFNPSRRSVPVIEEVDAEAEDQGNYCSEPIVEEPGDDHYPGNRDNSHHHNQRRGRWSRGQQSRDQDRGIVTSGLQMEMGPDGIPNVTTFGNGMGTTTFSYSSSYSSSGGPTQVYSTSTSTRIGTGGVRETQKTIRDSRSGKEEISISRGIGDRERTITRRRNATGREERIDTLQNMTSEEATGFDQEWMQQAEVNLPTPGGAFGVPTHSRGRSGDRRRLEYRRSRDRHA